MTASGEETSESPHHNHGIGCVLGEVQALQLASVAHNVAMIVFLAFDDLVRGFRATTEACDPRAVNTIDNLNMQGASLLALMYRNPQDIPSVPTGPGWRPVNVDDLDALEAWTAGRVFRRRYGARAWEPTLNTRPCVELGVYTEAQARRGLAAEWRAGWQHEGQNPTPGRWLRDDVEPLGHLAYNAYGRYRGFRTADGPMLRWHTDDDLEDHPELALLEDERMRDAWCLAAAAGRGWFGPLYDPSHAETFQTRWPRTMGVTCTTATRPLDAPTVDVSDKIMKMAGVMYRTFGDMLEWSLDDRPVPRWTRADCPDDGPVIALDDGCSEGEYVLTGWCLAALALWEHLNERYAERDRGFVTPTPT